MSTPTPQEQILGIVNNYWQSCCLGAAAQLELADHLANGPLHVDVLAERTETHAPSLYRMLRALESTGIFTQSSPRVFTNTPASECLRRHATGSQWAWIRIALCADAPVFDGWRGLMRALENGRPGFDQLRGQPAWDYLRSDPQQGTIFNEAMRDLSASMTPAVTESYDWSQFPVIADIGGGIGAQLLNILDARPAEEFCSTNRRWSRKLSRIAAWNAPAETSLRKLQYKPTRTCCDGSSTTGLTTKRSPSSRTSEGPPDPVRGCFWWSRSFRRRPSSTWANGWT
jgi:O-methyltransferase domain